MPNYEKNNFFILTGAMGSGKSTLLQALMAHQFTCVTEPARPILAEQKSIDGTGIPGKDEKLFVELMLSRAIFQYNQMQTHQGPVIFDRGIPDNIGYADLFGLEIPSTHNASQKYRYNQCVFFVPGWAEIYKTDDERIMSFEAANQFGNNIRDIYLNLGYKLIDVPFESAEIRAQFIINTITESMANNE